MIWKRSVIFIFFFIYSWESYSQETVKVQRIHTPIVLDGVLDDEEWKDIEPLDYGIYLPSYGGPSQTTSEMYLTYDDKYIYLGGKLFCDPSDITDAGKSRDLFKPNNDYFGLILDTFNDYENGLAFFTSPSGLRLDFTIFNDAQGMEPINSTWNTFWDAKTTKTSEGWFAEIRVPFSSLRFQDDNGVVTMGFITWRWIPALNEEHIYPMVPNDLGEWSSVKPSSAKRIVFEGIHSQKPAYFTPYILGGIQSEKLLDESETQYDDHTEPQFNAGFDLKYGITSNLTLDLTANPDFAQVEVDDQQVNLTRFSLFFPEKRLFFQERASLFTFNMGGPNTIFYSRRIGLYEDEIVPIYGGLRLNGRVGNWDMGLINMQTKSTDSLPSTNYGVLRLRKQIINSNSYVGTMLTNQIDINGKFNTNFGLDGIFKLYKDHFMNINYAQTFESDSSVSFFSQNNSKFITKLERRSNRGFGYDLSYENAGPRYNPAMGFELREDYTRMGNQVWWAWLPGEESKLFSHQVFLRGSIFKKNTDWSTESAEAGLGWRFQSKTNWGGNIMYQKFEEGVQESFTIGDAEIPAGRYNFEGVTSTWNTAFTKPLAFLLNTYIGSFYDGKAATIGISPNWSPSPSFEFTMGYEYNYGNFQERNESYKIHLASIKATYMFSNALSAALFVQYNNDSDEVVTNFRIRYNPKEGNDLYIVYNDNLYTDRSKEFPTLPLYGTRALVIKYSYTFTWIR